MKIWGFVVFLLVAGMAFWLLTFVALFVGYWISINGLSKISPKLAHKIAGVKEEEETK